MRFDVTIVGGGLAGLLLARHLSLHQPGLRLAVVDKAALPRPRELLRLGESTSEAGSWYLCERLGLEGHLNTEHLPKHGLRFFFADPLRRGLARRPEFGPMTPGKGYWEIPFTGINPPTFQLHRGRIEHHLAAELQGVEVIDQAVVTGLQAGRPHRLTIEQRGTVSTLQSEWIVDAGGLRGPLAQILPGGPRPVGHRYRATWFWVEGRIDPEKWTDDAEFHDRIAPDLRWRSTVHLVGEGYWVWLIALTSGHTSIGIVADPALPDPGPDVVGWLRDREPELARELEGRTLPVPSGRLIEGASAGWVVSEHRVARTGDAAGFIDPLYSGAIDLIALSNELIAGVIKDDRAGLPVARRCRYANVLRERIVGQFLPLYQGMYTGLLGNPRVFAAKVAWDNALYFSTIALWWRSGQIGDPEAFLQLSDTANRTARLQDRVQHLVRAWAKVEDGHDAAGKLDIGTTQFIFNAIHPLWACHRDGPLREASAKNLERLEALAVCFFERAAAGAGLTVPEGPLNPYGISLDPAKWKEDGLTAGRARVRPSATFRRDAQVAWMDE